MIKKRVLFVFGTRPEAIKMAPIIKECEKRKEYIDYKICVTGQHREMLHQVMDFFEIRAHYDLMLMQPNQNLSDITSNILKATGTIYTEYKPDIVLVQGDTTTAMAATMSAFYQKISVGHVEAGLRSFDKYAPFPEEINRKIISSIADFHFAPTKLAAENLKNEGINKSVFITGNTVIDALLWGVKKTSLDEANLQGYFSNIDFTKKIILVTAHRRESFGEPFEDICNALLYLVKKYYDIEIVYPVHLNPNVQEVVTRKLLGQQNIHLVKPLDYAKLVWIMNKSYLVLTDSGGIQEEAPSLGKPVLVLRNVTERQEGIEAGTAKLVGTDKKTIIENAQALLNNDKLYTSMVNAINPYGKGDSAEQIVSILINYL